MLEAAGGARLIAELDMDVIGPALDAVAAMAADARRAR
jgi:hypothetical protein